MSAEGKNPRLQKPHPCHHARHCPEKPAYIMAGSGQVVTYAQLDRRSNQVAHLFRQLGLKPGDHVALLMENNAHFMQIVWGAQRAGLVYTAISTHLKRSEVAYIVGNSDARVVVSSSQFQELIQSIRETGFDHVHFFSVDAASATSESWQAVLASQPEYPIADEKGGVRMLYSSGTTGQPKGVFPEFLSGTPIDEPQPTIQHLARVFRFDPRTIYLSTAPLYHAAPLGFNLVTMHYGGTSIIMEKFDAENALELIQRHRCTHSQWVPTMFTRMLALPKEVRCRYDLGSMHMAIHAAAPCPVDIKRRMLDWWGNVLWEYYASTESVGFTVIDSHQWLERPGSVGKPANCRIHILGEAGEELPPGQLGAVYISGMAKKFAYYKEDEKTREAYNERGWVTVGDVGYVDEDGFLFLTDRKNFMIISGGVNIYPQEVENLLLSHDKVADAAVFGIPNAEFGEEVKAVVQPNSWDAAGPELERELIAWCRERLSNLKVPKSIDFDPQLPRMDNGKLYKRQLIERYRQQ